MAELANIREELASIDARYRRLVSKLAELGIPGAIDPVALTCNCGESCHGGSPDAQLLDRVIQQAKIG